MPFEAALGVVFFGSFVSALAGTSFEALAGVSFVAFAETSFVVLVGAFAGASLAFFPVAFLGCWQVLSSILRS